MNSLLSNEQTGIYTQHCYVCGTPFNLHRHHIYGGRGRRRKSEKYGCWVYLCAPHHNMSNKGVHFNTELDLQLKRKCQKEWEQRFGSREDFIKEFGMNYKE